MIKVLVLVRKLFGLVAFDSTIYNQASASPYMNIMHKWMASRGTVIKLVSNPEGWVGLERENNAHLLPMH